MDDIIKYHIYPHLSIEFHSLNKYWYNYGLQGNIYNDPRITSNPSPYFIKACSLYNKEVISHLLPLLQDDDPIKICIEKYYTYPLYVICHNISIYKKYIKTILNSVIQYNNKYIFKLYNNFSNLITQESLYNSCRTTTFIFQSLFLEMHNILLRQGLKYSKNIINKLVKICIKSRKSSNLNFILEHYKIGKNRMYKEAFFEDAYDNKNYEVMKIFIMRGMLGDEKFVFEDISSIMIRDKDIGILQLLSCNKYNYEDYMNRLIKYWIRFGDKEDSAIIHKIYMKYICSYVKEYRKYQYLNKERCKFVDSIYELLIVEGYTRTAKRIIREIPFNYIKHIFKENFLEKLDGLYYKERNSAILSGQYF